MLFLFCLECRGNFLLIKWSSGGFSSFLIKMFSRCHKHGEYEFYSQLNTFLFKIDNSRLLYFSCSILSLVFPYSAYTLMI